MKVSNRTKLLSTLNQLIAGIQKHMSSASTIVANGTYTGAQLVAVLQPLATVIATATASRAAWLNDAADEEKTLAQANEFLTSLMQAIYAAYGNSVATLADFGLAPRKRTEPSAEVKAAAALKAKATRAAKKGVVAAPAVTPPVTK